MKIFKYTFRPTEKMTFAIPQNSEFICVQEQHGLVALWFKFFQEGILQQRKFEVVCTGQEFEANRVYLGTVQMHDGAFVCHVFEDVS